MSDIDARKVMWNDFLSHDSKIRNMFLVNCLWQDEPRPPLWPERRGERIDWIMRKYEAQLQNVQWLDDDTVPYLDMLTGTEIFAEAFGCRVVRPEDNNPFALPLIHSAEEVSRLPIPDFLNSSLGRIFDMCDELRQRAGDGAIFRLPDIQSPMDIAALIWDKNDFYAAILEEPEAVKELSGKVYGLLTSFFDEWFRRYGSGFVAHFPTYYMQKGITLSEDEIGIVNGDLFREFYLPELQALSDRYGGIGIHCCADSRHQWENLKRIRGLRLLNLHRPVEVLTEAYGFFAETTAQYHSWFGEGPASTWPEQRPQNARFVIETSAASREEAAAVCGELREKLHRS